MEPEGTKITFPRESDEQIETSPRELTKFEKDMIEKSKIRHKENIVKPQVIMGREFKGTSFIADPAKIIFKDFEVGRLHQQTIQMTNVSLSFNSFKLLEMNDSIKDFFNIVYKPSGRIGAGISAPILIQFIPQVNEDIFGFLPLLSETGPINVPIECTSKKAIVTVDDPIVDFKKVIYGGSLKKYLKFTNAGALQTEIIFKNNKGTHLGQKYDASSSKGSSVYRGQRSRSAILDEDETNGGVDVEEEKIMEQVKFQKTAIIGGYSSITIAFEYTPSEIAPLDFEMMAYFENYLHSPPIPIRLQGECVEVPIYVEKPLYDFEICLPHHIYRERVIFFNRAKTAMKVQIEAPRESKRFFEFNPSLGYIQAESKFEIWVKLIAEPELLTMCAKYSTGENVLTIPFKLIGADQVLPVEFDIRVKMTTDKIQFTPSTLNFGKLYENTANSKILKIQNFSDLPQELMFFPLPKNIKIMPDLVPLKILPKETISVDVIYQGREAALEETEMRCKIVTGNLAARDTKLSYRAETVRCPLHFSTHKVQIPAIQINEKYDLNITVTNTSKNNTYVFEFFLPYYEICGLRMTPMVQQLAPGKSVDVVLEYNSFFKKLGPYTMEELIEKYEKDPNKNFAYRMKLKEEEKLRLAEEEKRKEEEAKNPKKGAKAAAPEKKEVKKAGKLTKQQEKELEEETKRQQELERQREEEEKQKRLELERNFDVKGELQKLGGKIYEFGESGEKNFSQHYEWIIPCYFSMKNGDDVGEANLCYIEVSTVTVTKRLVANRDLIDFGEMAVGFRKVEELQLTNCGDDAADLRMEMLPLFGGFSIIGALRTVDIGKTKGILVQFEPHAQQYFEETLKIYTKTSSVSIKLKGSGVNPEVKLTPESGLLNCGGVLLGEFVEKTFTIQNLSNFQLSFKLISKAKGIQNKHGSQVFSFIPSEGKIQAHKTLEVKVVFRPDRVSENFYEVITIDVPHQKDEKSLYLAGMCFPRQAWITLYKPFVFPNLKELQKKELENPLDFVTVKDSDTVFGCGNNRILLEFKKMENKGDKDDECFFKRITIGSSKLLDPKAEKPTNFEITMPKEEKQVYFTCDSLKDNVPAGGNKVVTFTFKPPQPDAFIGDIKAMEGIGQWIEQKAEVKITGGLARQGFSEQFNIEVILRAYIDQI